jgi:Fucose 4-O-acetylase and related acetyltransferases
MKQRLTYIDALRGFAIFLVVLGHLTDFCGYTDSTLFGFIYSFHMPLFMAIAGFVCAYSCTDTLCVDGKGGFWKFIWKKFRFIMIPYFVWALIVQPFFFNPWTGNIGWMEAFNKACIINDSFWFLPCLFLLQVGYAVYKWLRETIKVKHWALDITLVAVLGIAVAALYYFTKVDFFRSVISYWLPFFTGVFMGQFPKFDKFVSENQWLYAITVIALCLTGGLYVTFDGMAEKGIRLACGMISIPVWFGFFKNVKMPLWLSNALCYTGKNTLVIYLMQMCFMPKLPVIPGLNPFLQIVVFSLMSILMIALILLIAKVLEQNTFLRQVLLGRK